MENCKFFYFFRGSLATHVDLYKGWVDKARERGIQIEMVTILSFSTYKSQHELVKSYSKFDYINILIYPPLLSQVITFFYFLLKALKSKKIVIHLRKQSPTPIDLLKRIFKSRIKYIIELEGDPQSEMEYLTEHPYKTNFYKNHINSTVKYIDKLPIQLKNADHILTVTEKLRLLLDERYPAIGIKNKCSVIPTGVDVSNFYFSESFRKEKREELKINEKFCFIYIGNAFYSWQNVYRTIKIFKLLQETIFPWSAFLLLLIRKQDHIIVQEFITKQKIPEESYLLTNVSHDEVVKYLNAADLGILLRHHHTMNEAASPGKLWEYLATGLPIMTTSVCTLFPQEIAKYNFGIILTNMDDDEEVKSKFTTFQVYDKNRRIKIREWAKKKFSTEAHAYKYVEILNELAD